MSDATTKAAPAAKFQGCGCTMPCPLCNEEAAIALWLDDGQFFCRECDSIFDRGTVEGFIRRWSALLGWLDSLPPMPKIGKED